MSGIATAMVATAVLGGVASNRASNKASSAQNRSSDAAIAATQQAAEEARADVNRIFPQAQQTANLGFQGALDVFGQSAPAQMDVFQQGNLGAQQALLSGLPQMQNAILGGNVDLSGLQTFQIQQPDLGFLQQQTPMNIQAEQERIQAEDQDRINALNTAPQQTPVLFGQNFLGGNQGGFNFNQSNLLSGKFNNTP